MTDDMKKLLKNNKHLSPNEIKRLTKLLNNNVTSFNKDGTVQKMETTQKEFKPVTSKYLNKNFVQM